MSTIAAMVTITTAIMAAAITAMAIIGAAIMVMATPITTEAMLTPIIIPIIIPTPILIRIRSSASASAGNRGAFLLDMPGLGPGMPQSRGSPSLKLQAQSHPHAGTGI